MTGETSGEPEQPAELIASSFPIRRYVSFPTFRRDTVTCEVGAVAAADLVGAVVVVVSRHNDDGPVRVGVATGPSGRVVPVTFRPEPHASASEFRERVAALLGRQVPGTPDVVVVGGETDDRCGIRPVDGRFVLGGGRIDLDYSADLFDPAAAASLLEQVVLAAGQLRSAAERSLRDLDIVSERERRKIIARDDRPTPPDPPDPWDMIRRAERRAPDRIALVDESGSLTYRDLMSQVHSTMDSMTDAGVGAGDVVTVPVAPDRWTVIAMLAALGSRACYVPIDPRAPGERQRVILDQVLPSADLVRHGTRVVARPGAAATETTGRSGVPVGAGSGLDRPCYVLFTSGSTGVPKGVAISRRSLASLLAATEPTTDRTADEVWISIHSFAFDASVWEVYGSLCYGTTLVVASADERRDPGALVAMMECHGVTSLTVSPTAFEGFKRVVADRPLVVSALERIILCAEPLSVPSVDDWFERWGDDHPALLNMYGITETTVHSTVERLRRSAGEQRIRIGTGLPDTPIFVVDPAGRLVPDGVAGEMLVGGDGVALGYVGPHCAALDERFVPDDFGERPARRLYRSGDVARRLGDGTLEYLGRRDRQLKIRGHRIEAGDVEAAALRHDGVGAARAWAQPGNDGSMRLCLGVQARAGEVSPASMTDHLCSLLPEYMVPTVVVVVDAFPTTVNGKLDFGVLLRRHRQGVQRAAEMAGPPSGTSRARALARAMAEVLGLDDLPLDANFFRAGGDSISAIRLVAALREAGLEVSLAEIYRHRTVAALAGAAGEPVAAQGREADRGPARLPATPLQRAMIYHNFLDGSACYHDLLHYRVDAVLDERLRAALDAVTVRHPALCSAFGPAPGGGLEQRIAATAALELAFHDARDGDDVSDLTERLREWGRRERARGFDVAVPGLARIAVHRLGAGASVLSVSVHHVILDGWSASLFVTELLAVWAGREPDPRPVPGDETVLQEYQRLVEQSCRDPETRAFWAQRLAAMGYPVIDHGALTGGPPRVLRMPLEQPACAAFDRYAEELGVSARSVFVALHHAAAAAVGPGTPTSGLVTGGRPEVLGGAEALGLFLNTLPARLELDGLTWRDAVHRTFDDEIATAPFRRFPASELQAMAGRPIVDFAFNYTHFRSYTELESGGVSVESAWYDEQTEFPLLATINRAVGDGGAELVLVTRAGVEDGLEQRYAQAFGVLCASLCSSLDARVEVPAARGGSGAAAVAVTELSGARRPINCGELLAAIRDRAHRHPEAVAVLDGEIARTYAQLWAEVSELGGRLEDVGVCPGSRLLIESRRGVGMVTAMLATWLRGASVVPVDAGLPPQRRELLAGLAAPVARATVHGVGVTVAPASDAVRGGGARSSEDRLDPRAEAYLLFTSGTTGVPKGVAMPFEALANLVGWQVRRFGPAGPGRVALFAAVGFDVSLQETLACLVGGGTLVVVPAEVKIDPQATLRLLRQRSVDVLFTPPLILRQLARTWQALGEAPALRWVIAAGEQLVVDDTLRAFGTAGGFRLVNQYGPTETHVVTEADLGADVRRWPDTPGIGLPVDNVTVRGEPASRTAGSVSELIVSGPAVALGYVPSGGGPAEVSDGFSALAGTRMYRTGDLARLGAHGIEFYGRSDAQVKIRGYRVDVVEIERTVRAIDAVADCAVRVARGAHEVVLHAVVQPRAGATLDEHTVRSHLGDHLPVYAIPATVEIVAALAADNRGKVDRSAVPARRMRSRSGAGHSPVERTVVQAWSEILGRRQTAVDESFFAAGGSSLLLLDLFLKLRASIGVSFEIRHMLQYPTISSFVGFIRSLDRYGGTVVDVDSTVH